MLARIRKAHEDEGFTLIELLIVIIILGILAAIVVFAVGSTRGDAVASACRTDVKAEQLSLEAYNVKQGHYPAAATDALAAANFGGVLKSLSTNENYTIAYAQTGSGTGYTLTIAAANQSGISGSPVIDQNSTDTNVKTACSKP